MSTLVIRKGHMNIDPTTAAVTGATWLGGLLGTVLLTRSVAKKKLQAAIDAATEEIKASNKSLMESQNMELVQLRVEVGNLRQSTGTLVALNQRYVMAMADKDLEINELRQDLRIRDQRITALEVRLSE